MATDLETLKAWDKAHLWHPFTAQADWAAADPIVIDRAEGVYLFDAEGRRYLDGNSSLWCNVHGHRHPTLDAALRSQIDKISHATLLGLTNAPAIELAHELAKRAPEGLTRVFFSDSGATAVEVALKMAFQYWRQKAEPEPERNLFLALDGAYHGDTLGDVSIGGVDRFHTMFSPLLFPTLRAPNPYCYRCPVGKDPATCKADCLDALEQILIEHPGQIAAVVAESKVQGAAGMIVQPEGFLRGLRDLTRKHGTLLILDEVAVGFGRTGKLFACEHEGVSPDFLCLAKGITGGYMPLAATLTTEEVYSAFYATAAEGKTFYHGHTYCGNPLGCSVALASLRVFDEEKTLETMAPKVEHLRKRLAAIAELPAVGDVRQAGFIVGIELVADKATKAPFPDGSFVGAQVCRQARKHGVMLRPLGDVIVLMPPLAATIDDLDLLCDAVARSIAEVSPS